jgi:hypothetical protein
LPDPIDAGAVHGGKREGFIYMAGFLSPKISCRRNFVEKRSQQCFAHLFFWNFVAVE